MNWEEVFFEQTYHTEEEQQTLFQNIKEAVTHYQDKFPEPIIDVKREQELTQWYYSNGQVELKKLFHSLWDKLDNFSHLAMPAHDARHALYKTPISALEYIHAEKLLSWEKVGFFGALLHDWGRWAEESVYGKPGSSVVHARMSFLLAQQFLEQFNIPDEIKWHILHAVLVHTTGAIDTDPMVTKITVAADREQLWGPEFILRLFHHSRHGEELKSVYQTISSQKQILTRIYELFYKRLPGPLYSRNEHLGHLRTISFQFLYLCYSEQERDILLQSAQSDYWLPFHLEQAIYNTQRFKKTLNVDLESIFKIFLQAKHISPNLYYFNDAVSRVLETPQEFHEHLNHGLQFVTYQRTLEDKRSYEALTYLVQYYQDSDPLLAEIAQHFVNFS